jgi:hypothetical protein
MTTNNWFRSLVISNRSLAIDHMINMNPNLDRSQLEKLSDDELVERGQGELLKGFEKTFSEARSSAPYSKGSSDQAMLSSSFKDPWRR